MSEPEIKTHREFYPYYAAGWWDRLIAEKFYYSHETVVSWRKRYGLKARSPKRLPYYDSDEVQKLYDAGFTDGEIAARVHCRRRNICGWRKNHGDLPLNSPRKTYSRSRFRKLYDAGKNDVEISSACGCCAQTVYLWRKKNHLPTKYKRRYGRKA